MIKQLQRRFIRIAVVALTVAMVLVVGIVNVANWISVRGELFSTLSLIEPAETTDEIPAAPVILPPEPAETAPPARREEDGEVVSYSSWNGSPNSSQKGHSL